MGTNSKDNAPKKRTIVEVATELESAKDNVRYLLDNANGSVGMHGLEYWAGVVTRLRDEMKSLM